MKTRLSSICLLLLLGACSKSVPRNFDDISGIYFNNTGPKRMICDTSAYTFVYEADTLDFILVPVRLQLLGRTSASDRSIDMEIISDDSLEGRDYAWKSDLILPADSTVANLQIALYRSEELKAKEKSLTLILHGNSEFILPFSHHKLSSGNEVSAVNYTIRFSEMFTAAPQGWRSIFVGAFSQRKFELLCKVSGIDRQLFNSPNAISDAKWMFMRSRVLEYILEQENLRASGKPYDLSAFDEDGMALDFNQ